MQKKILVEEPNPNVKKYKKELSIELSGWTDAIQWSKLEKDVIKYKRNGTTYLCLSSGQVGIFGFFYLLLDFSIFYLLFEKKMVIMVPKNV